MGYTDDNTKGGPTMATKTEATIEDLMHAPDDAMYELIDGKLVRMPPTGFEPNRVAGEIFVTLRRIYPDNGKRLRDDRRHRVHC